MGVTQRLAADTNPLVDLLRRDRPDPPPLRDALVLFPLPVLGELFAGAHSSNRVTENLAKIEELIAKREVLHPDLETARIYGRLRAASGGHASPSRLNDLWIAALCLQHNLPLLTNDRGFTTVAGLRVIAR